MLLKTLSWIYQQLPAQIKQLVRPAVQRYPAIRMSYAKNSYIRTTGWTQSAYSGAPINSHGEPIPWYTYCSIKFLQSRLQNDFRVFEYGSGNSSLWYSSRVNDVVTVEDHTEWAAKMRDSAPPNLKVVHEPDLDNYPTVITKYEKFDIVVIDGRTRQACVTPALKSVTNDGIIILDDFERWSQTDWRTLRESGFRVLRFVGMKAQRLTESCTAILYRDQNCLGI